MIGLFLNINVVRIFSITLVFGDFFVFKRGNWRFYKMFWVLIMGRIVF